MALDPSMLSGLRLWLRAKDLGAGGSNVTTWTDQSGQANHATPPSTAPVVAASSTPNGGKSVDFEGRALNLTKSPAPAALISSASVTSTPAGSDFGAAKAIDGDRINTRWLGSDPSVGTPQRLTLTLSAATVVTYYKLWGHATATQYNPSAWTFEGSNDGSSWTTLDTRSGISWTAGVPQEFTFSNSTAYLYYRISITANVSATDFVAISEIILEPDPVAELWVVVKADSNTGNTTPWHFGASTQVTLYPWSNSQVVENFGVTSHSDLFTPTVSVAAWRLYRVSLTASGTMQIWIDNASEKTKTGLIQGWTSTPKVSTNFAGNIAEMFVSIGPALSAGDVADLVTYFNTEHGLTVPGGSTGGGTTGAVAATLPALTASAAGTVTLPTTTGAVAAVLPSLTASAAGTVTAPAAITGAVAATLPSLTANVSDALAASQALAAGFSFGSQLASSAVSVQHGMEAGFSFGSRLSQIRDWGIDARSDRPSPSVVIAQRDGTPVTPLSEVEIGPLSAGVGVLDSWRFSVDRDNAQGKTIDPVAHEAHLYRGSYLMSKGPIGPGRLENGRMVYDCADPRWYLNGGRFITRIPQLNWAYNGDFSKGTAGWHGAYSPGSIPEAAPEFYVVEEAESTSGYGLRIEGVDKVVTTSKDVETAAVFVANEATYLSGGEAILIAGASDIPDGADIHIVGHTADRRAYGDSGTGLALSLARAQAARASLAAHNSTWTFSLLPGLKSPNLNDGVVAGRGYYEQVASNSTEPESAKNRRVALHYASTQTASGHAQFVYQYEHNVINPIASKVPLTVTVAGRMRIGDWLGAPADGWALWIALYDSNGDIVGDPGTASMDEATPRQRWFDYSASVDVPPDGLTYRIGWRLYPPAGWAVWTDVGVYPEEQLGFFDVDQAIIVRDLTRHVQDTDFGHGNLGIGTRTPRTGITRTKEYPFQTPKPYGTAIEELVAPAKGVEVDCEVTPTTATIVTHYPQQGSIATLALTHGGARSIVKAYAPLPASGRTLASNIIVQAWGISSNRIKQYARDEAALGGTLLEAIIDADSDTPPSELDELAAQSLARSIHPLAAWEVVIDPARTSEVLDSIGKGDRVFLSLPDEGVHALHRLVLTTWDPETDVLSLQLAPWEA